MGEGALGPAVEFGDFFRCEFIVEIAHDFPDSRESFSLFGGRKPAELFNDFCRTHGSNVLGRIDRASKVFRVAQRARPLAIGERTQPVSAPQSETKRRRHATDETPEIAVRKGK